MTEREISRISGHRIRSGKPSKRAADDLPTKKELRELGKRFYSPHRERRASYIASPEFWARLLAKLIAASKRRRGLPHMTRDELDAVMRKLQETNHA